VRDIACVFWEKKIVGTGDWMQLCCCCCEMGDFPGLPLFSETSRSSRARAFLCCGRECLLPLIMVLAALVPFASCQSISPRLAFSRSDDLRESKVSSPRIATMTMAMTKHVFVDVPCRLVCSCKPESCVYVGESLSESKYELSLPIAAAEGTINAFSPSAHSGAVTDSRLL
jgi:hypothetical protein